MKNRIYSTIFACFITFSSFAQSKRTEDITAYEDMCFCNVGLAHPMSILNLDNNKEVLFALKKGKTLHQLEQSGMSFSKSQIALLKLANLIERNDSIYKTLVPILQKEETIALRKKTKVMAQELIPKLEADYLKFKGILDSKGLEKNSYSLYFAFVLDGLVWDFLSQSNEIEETNITKQRPFWEGTFWMISPKRDFTCGTNSMSVDDYSISANWSDKSGVSVSSYQMLRAMLKDYVTNGRITKTNILKEFKDNALFNAEGKLQIPVIKADSTDIIYKQSEVIAKKVVHYLINTIDYSQILPEWTSLNKGQKITILYHEIMWDILELMEGNGQIEKPIAFGKPKEAKAHDLKELIFIVEY